MQSRPIADVPGLIDAAASLLAAPVLSLRLASAHRGDDLILGALNFALRPGETVAITGPSGVGKTTLLRILAGLSHEFDGTLCAPDRVGMVFQEPVLLPWRSSRDNLAIACGIGPDAVDMALAEVGLRGQEDHFPGQMSLGQQRRLALARGFASGAPVLLMDEPFVSLDQETASEVMGVYEALRARHQVSTVLVTHDAGEVTRLADRVLRLDGQPARIVEG